MQPSNTPAVDAARPRGSWSSRTELEPSASPAPAASLVGAALALRPRACLPPMWRELRSVVPWLRESAGVLGPVEAADSSGEPVILVPGLFASDRSLAPLGKVLRATGHDPRPARITCNVDCSEATTRRLLDRVESVSAERGRRVALVGHSRGGLLARVVAQRRPDLVAGVITLGSPQRDQLAVHPLLWAQLFVLGSMRAAGVPGLIGFECGLGACCERFRHDLAAPVPRGVGYLSIYSRNDGVVDWRACLDPAGRNVEVAASHAGMPFDPAVARTLTTALTRFERAGRRRGRRAAASGGHFGSQYREAA